MNTWISYWHWHSSCVAVIIHLEHLLSYVLNLILLIQSIFWCVCHQFHNKYMYMYAVENSVSTFPCNLTIWLFSQIVLLHFWHFKPLFIVDFCYIHIAIMLSSSVLHVPGFGRQRTELRSYLIHSSVIVAFLCVKIPCVQYSPLWHFVITFFTYNMFSVARTGRSHFLKISCSGQMTALPCISCLDWQPNWADTNVVVFLFISPIF